MRLNRLEEELTKVNQTKGLPAPLRQVWKPMWLLSLGVHGVLLAVPIPLAEKPKPELEKKPQELVRLTQLEPKPAAVTIDPKIEKERFNLQIKRRPQRTSTPIAAKPTPTPTPKPVKPPAQPVASPSSVVVSPSPQQQPVAINPFPPQTEIELAQKQELLPPPQVVPSATSSVDVAASPSSSPKPIATSEIQGVPIDPTWQVVENPAQAIAEADMFVQPNGKPYSDIVGQIAQVPNKNPDLVFEEFFRPQLENANFQVEPFGTYAPGGGLYRLTHKDNAAVPLYLTLAPDKQGTGTIVTIWKKYPNFEE